jgi:hypothetical protein
MRDLHSGDLGFLVGSIDHGPDAGSICPIPSGHASERLDVVCTDDEDWAAGLRPR